MCPTLGFGTLTSGFTTPPTHETAAGVIDADVNPNVGFTTDAPQLTLPIVSHNDAVMLLGPFKVHLTEHGVGIIKNDVMNNVGCPTYAAATALLGLTVTEPR